MSAVRGGGTLPHIRALAALGLVLLAPAPARPAECPWVEPKEGPLLRVEDGLAQVRYRLDPKWFRCAKEAGGTLSLTFLLGDGKELTPFREKAKLGSTIQESLFRSQFCERRPPPTRVQARLVGTGAFERLTWTSEIASLHCDRCTLRGYETFLALHVKNGLTPPGMVTLQGGYDAEFQKCALEGSTLEMRFYPGRSEQEALLAREHTFVLRGLEQAPKFRKSFSHADLCRESPKFVGWELFGTGELAQLNGTGRSVSATKCD